MARIYTYVIVAVLLVVVFNFLNISIGANTLEDLLNLATGQITVSDFWESMFDIETGILAALSLTGIVIGFTVGIEGENLLMIPFITTTLVTFVSVFVALVDYTNDWALWSSSIILVMVGGLIAGFAISVLEWFRGNI